jgi:hypothetical protein
MLVLFLLYFVIFALSMSGMLARAIPGWSPHEMLPVVTGVTIVLLLLIGLPGYLTPPKCPHCGTGFSAWLLHIAIASGRCGVCGESIEE